MRLDVDLGPDAVAGQFTTTAISPDGTAAGISRQESGRQAMLATRLLSETKPALLSGTDNGRDPFFSPDGQWIGFFADGKMKKISVQGGAPVVLCDAPRRARRELGRRRQHRCGIEHLWCTFARTCRRRNTSAGHQTAGRVELTAGRRLYLEVKLFCSPFPLSAVAFEDASIAAVSLKTGEIKILVRGGYFGRYLPTGDATGHLVYVHEGVLFGCTVRSRTAGTSRRGSAPAGGLGGRSEFGRGTIQFLRGTSGPEPSCIGAVRCRLKIIQCCGWTTRGRPSH